MNLAGIDVLFVTDPSNMAWLTGYDGCSFYVHQGVIVPGTGDPFWWGRGQDANGAWGDYPAIAPLLPSGRDAAAPHLTGTGCQIRVSDWP